MIASVERLGKGLDSTRDPRKKEGEMLTTAFVPRPMFRSAESAVTELALVLLLRRGQRRR